MNPVKLRNVYKVIQIVTRLNNDEDNFENLAQNKPDFLNKGLKKQEIQQSNSRIERMNDLANNNHEEPKSRLKEISVRSFEYSPFIGKHLIFPKPDCIFAKIIAVFVLNFAFWFNLNFFLIFRL